MIKNKINHTKKDTEKGFTLFEVLLTVALVSVSLLTLFSIISSINKTDIKAKEDNFTKQLIDVYISYYNDIEITKENVSLYTSDFSEVNLVKNLKNNGGNVPTVFRNLDVICNNTPSLIKQDGSDYVLFTITCEKNGKKISRGNGYSILKYIN